MQIIITVIAIIAAVFFLTRYLLIKRSIKDIDVQLKRIIKKIDENQIVKLANPDRNLEQLLETMNISFKNIRKERVFYEHREKEFQKQIENISHDLRTPLTSMIGYLELMDISKLCEEEKESFEVVHRKAEYLQRLISQFYDFSRLTGDDYRLNIERLDINRTLREAAVDYYGELNNKNIKAEFKLVDEPVFVNADKNALDRIFANLIQNVCKYALDTLKIELVQKEDRVIVLFRNNTNSITKKDAENLFERFYKGDAARTQSSTGLGLTIAKNLIEKMNGSLTAELVEEHENEWLSMKLEFQKCWE